MKALEERVKHIIEQHLGVDEKEITPSASFEDDLGADSLDVVELAMAFEEEFDLDEIPDDDLDHMKTVQQAISYLRARGAGVEQQKAGRK